MEEEESTSGDESELNEMEGRLDQYEDVQQEQDKVKNSKQWVILGANYQTALPIEELGIVDCCARETLRVGGTFVSKEYMTIALGLYNLHNRVETVVLSSYKRRYS